MISRLLGFLVLRLLGFGVLFTLAIDARYPPLLSIAQAANNDGAASAIRRAWKPMVRDKPGDPDRKSTGQEPVKPH